MSYKVTEVDAWHLQEKDDIHDAVKDWSYHRFACLMKDNTLQLFTGIRDETVDGHIDTHIDCMNDLYDVDDILVWI